MQPKKIWSNMGVSDLERTYNFYNALGFKPNCPLTSSDQLTSFLMGDDNFVMHFFLKDILQTAMKGAMTDTQNSNEVMYTLSAESRADVDLWATEVKNAGGTIISEPEAFGQGYYGFVFADPDGHKFNVFFM